MNKLSTVKVRFARLSLALILTMTLVVSGSETKPVAASAAKAIAAGWHHTCITTSTGDVKCWGNNEYGQLGNGNNTSSTTPVDVNNLEGVVKISTGNKHTCAVTSEGGVKCWGDGSYGKLGNGNYFDSNVPVDVWNLNSRVVAIAAGGNHACVLMETGGVKCWGDNSYGPLGDGTTFTKSATPKDVNGLTSGVVAIAAGLWHTCALMETGGMKCWGYNGNGQIGNGTGTVFITTPVNVSSLTSGVVAIAAGDRHTCALMETGEIKCWGDNNYGQNGDGTYTNSNIPVNVAELSGGVITISAGGSHTCVLTINDGVKCWGANGYGQLGDETHTTHNTPSSVVGLGSDVIAISAGFMHTCALTGMGGVQCWGWNDYGQLGNGTYVHSTKPLNVSGLMGLTLLEHDAHLTEWGNYIDTTLADIIAILNSFNLENLDVAVSSRASQTSLDVLGNVVNQIQSQLTAFDLSNLDVTVSSRASQASVDALSGTVSEVQTRVNEINTRMDGVEQSLSTIEASLNACQVEIALVPNGAGHNGNTLEFYVHTTQASERIEPESLSIWVGGTQMDPNITTIIPGVTWILLDGSWSDLKNQPLMVEVTTGGQACSSMVVIQ